jgi:predicted phosphodiesterase
VCEDLASCAETVPADYWTRTVPELLSTSATLQAIRRSLLEDAAGLSTRALEYEHSRLPGDENSPTLQALTSLGVLQFTSAVRARLCPGVIKELVTEVARNVNTEPVLGTVLRESGRNLYVPSSLNIAEDDIVVVHISDVHVGEPYAYRVPSDDAERYDGRSAARMLADDLKQCGVNRVDALVVSGDFTNTAELSEFLRARDVLSEITSSIGVPHDRLVLVAGNHDVKWNPPSTAKVNPTSGVSREEYATFRELMGRKRGDPLFEARILASASGKTAIRLITLDSNHVEGPIAGGIGYVTTQTLEDADRALGALVIPDTVEQVTTWLVVHHHVFPVTSASLLDAHARKVSVMANSATLLSFALQWQVELILHGHEHQPSITIARRWPIERGHALAPLCVAGAGSFACKLEYLGPFARNHYFIHVRRRDDILIRSRMTGDQGLGWVGHGDLCIPSERSVGEPAVMKLAQ